MPHSIKKAIKQALDLVFMLRAALQKPLVALFDMQCINFLQARAPTKQLVRPTRVRKIKNLTMVST